MTFSSPQKKTFQGNHFLLWRRGRLRTRGKTPYQIAVGKKVLRHAVDRNRLKRQIREILRKQKEKISSKEELVIKVHKAPPLNQFRMLEKEITALLNTMNEQGPA